jgi:hypothetical protein
MMKAETVLVCEEKAQMTQVFRSVQQHDPASVSGAAFIEHARDFRQAPMLAEYASSLQHAAEPNGQSGNASAEKILESSRDPYLV